jgi:hypothetical protein
MKWQWRDAYIGEDLVYYSKAELQAEEIKIFIVFTNEKLQTNAY